MILGIGMRGIFPFLPSPDQASSIMASTVMSPLLGALFLVAMLSAIMSTVNSILLVTGGAFAHDLYKRLIDTSASQRRLVWVNRISIVALGVVPFWFATRRLGDVQAIVIEQAKFIASFFFVPVVLGLNWRRGTREGRHLEHGGRLPRLLDLDVHAAEELRDAWHRLGRSRRRRECAHVRDRQPDDEADAPGEPANLLRRRAAAASRGQPRVVTRR